MASLMRRTATTYCAPWGLGDAYELAADTTTPELLGDDGKPLVLPKGSWVVDAWY